MQRPFDRLHLRVGTPSRYLKYHDVLQHMPPTNIAVVVYIECRPVDRVQQQMAQDVFKRPRQDRFAEVSISTKASG